MARIALLHPQCARLGGAIKMVLMTAHALQNEGHEVTLYTFERRDTCFPELQKGLTIRVWGRADKKEEKWVNLTTSIKDKKWGFFIFDNSFSFPPQKVLNMMTLAFHLRHVDMIIANNPPMQIVCAFAKVFSFNIKHKWRNNREKSKEMDKNTKRVYHFEFWILNFELSTLWTIWWHHHTPWYYGSFKPIIFAKALFEKIFVIPFSDEMVSTSHYVADTLKAYCGRKSRVIHPVLSAYPQNVAHEKPINDQVTMFTHGRLEEGKWLDMIARVFEKIHKEKIKQKWEGIVSVIPAQAGIQAWIEWNTDDTKLTGLDSRLHGSDGNGIHLIIFWTGSLEWDLREKWIDVRPFDREKTFSELLSGKYGHVLGVYCSSIDAFGMASLECQMMDIPTVILDRAGARETIVTNEVGEPVGYLVDSEESLFRIISHYVEEKTLPKWLSNVNFSHKKPYFSRERLSWDLLALMSKTQV